MKHTLAFINPASFWDTDKTVLRHLTNCFNVHFFFIYNPTKSNQIEDEVRFYCKQYGIVCHLFPRTIRQRSIKNISYYYRMIQEINATNPSLIYHCSNEFLFNLLLKCFAKTNNIVLGIHDVQIHSLEKSVSNLMRKWSRDISYSINKSNCVFSKNQAELYRELKGRDAVCLGMSCKDFGKSSLIPSNIKDGVRLLFFGSIHPYKGLHILIDALEQLADKGICNIHLTVAGKGLFWDTCKSLIKHPELYNLQIRFIDDKEVPNLMSSHHFLALPYMNATQSGPLLAALNYSLPIIAPNFGCFKDTYNPNAAFLYKENELQKTLEKVSQTTTEEYEKMRAECNNLKTLFSEEKIAHNYIEYFTKLIEDSYS